MVYTRLRTPFKNDLNVSLVSLKIEKHIKGEKTEKQLQLCHELQKRHHEQY